MAGQRTAVVTGAAAGIGLATAEALLAEGWRVLGIDRDQAALDQAAARLSPATGALRVAACDVTDAAACAAAVAGAARDFGPVRGLVTSAGVGSGATFFETTPELLRRMYEVNVIGTFNLAKPVAEAMRETGGGAIVTIASVSGLVGNFGRTAYGASKGAVVNLTRIMAVELARHGIRVNSVAPGPVDTAMVAQVHTPETRKQWNNDVLLRRYGTPAEIAAACAWLLDGDRSGYVTGQVIAVDGGFVAAGLVDAGWSRDA